MGEGIERRRVTTYDSLEELYHRLENPFTETAMVMAVFYNLLDGKQGNPSNVVGVGIIYTEYDSKGNIIRKHSFPGRGTDSNGALHIFVNDLSDLPEGYNLYGEELDDDGNVQYRVVELPEKVDSGTQSQSKISYAYLSTTYCNSKERLNVMEISKRLLYEEYGDAVPKYIRPD